MDAPHRAGEEGSLASHGQRILQSGVLGKSPQIIRLFEFLLERSLTATAPKEIEIAQVVFGRSNDMDLAADATVRVHVHRLRKKLDALPADERGERLALPRGEYRLVVVPSAAAAPGDPEDRGKSPAPARRGLHRWLHASGAALFLVFNAVCWIGIAGKSTRDPRTDSILWSGLAQGTAPVLVVSGSFYVFGERQAGASIVRMVADPDIASAEDLHRYQQHADGAGQKVFDMNTYHLPIGLASALVSVAPIVAATKSGNTALVREVTTARFTNEMLGSHDIVYVGLLGDLRDLQEPFLDISGFSLSAGSDAVVDRKSGERFQSDWAEPSTERIMRRDYAYLARFPGPSGNHIVVVAGISDPALVEAAKLASDPAELDRLKGQLGSSEAFEALYEVRTFGPSNVSGTRLIARPLDVDRMWHTRKVPASKAGP
ncbi:helix-turn-helix domain-containing protein [Acidovorax sacchari]|uniref:helix-turn-helix domain-containing protein n=1 Tax=Acidovorax sacchari TaxID=3230736 RepID=UPI0039E4D7C9